MFFTRLLLFVGPLLVVVWGQGDWVEVDRIVENWRRENQVPGLALAFVNASGGGGVGLRGYGVSDREVGSPMTQSTRFLIASISKSFAALTTVRLLSERFPQLGKGVLDVPISELAPSFNLTLSDRYRTAQVTFRDLFAHRTCLNSYGLGVTAGAYQSRADRLYRYRYIQEKCDFRSRFEYSNAMFVLAGEVASHISGGTPFEDLVMTLLAQLGMTESLIITPTEDYERLPNMSRGYYLNLEGVLAKMNASVYNSHSGAAAGGVVSTAGDMAKYLHFHLNKGMNVDGVQVIPWEVLQWVYDLSIPLRFSPKLEEQTLLDVSYGYGLGLELGLYGTHQRITHEGDLSPFTSRLTMYPQLGMGMFTAINGPGGGGADHHALHNALTLHLTNAVSNPPPSFNTQTLTKKKDMKEERISSRRQFNPIELVGLYGHPYEGDIDISTLEDGQTLRLTYGIWGKGTLLPEDDPPNVYRIDWEGDIVAMFLAYNGGPPLPSILFDFPNPDTLIYIDSDGEVVYRRNATIDTYPPIPWEPGSCSNSHHHKI